MTRSAVSLTLSPESLLWLRAKSRADSARSLSQTVEELASRAAGAAIVVRSVVGTVRVSSSDPDLQEADVALGELFPALSAEPRRR